MWLWIAITLLFVFLVGRTLQENADSTRSSLAAMAGTFADAVALVCLTLGVFGFLVALVLGVFATAGPSLAGEALTHTLLWSAALIVGGVLLILLSVAIRRLGGKGAPARAVRAGH
ncbi:hypothetical protein [Falsiroseomonas sp. E2-1-a20]|uniref:hypothetical protein n=1 Tax=Falsiroseomonas sp. E2-1-a20 TaxID=3239300 RepID=UPI003F40B3C0